MADAAQKMISAMYQVGEASRPEANLMVGTVLDGTEAGLRIRCDGLELSREDLWISPRLLTGYSPKLAGTLHGTCSSHGGTVTVPVSKDQLTRSEFDLHAGDRVIVFTPDGQEYFILDRTVKLS